MKNYTKDSVSPSLEGRRGMSVGCDDGDFSSPKERCGAAFPGWVFILKILITVLTALAGTLGVASCTKGEAPSNSPRGEDSIIAANIMHCQYENALISRDV